MDAFLNYLSNSDKFRDRFFVSEAPNPVILVWSSFESLPGIAGITIVQQMGASVPSSNNHNLNLVNILKTNIRNTFPVVEISYSADVSRFIIEGTTYNNEEAANIIAETLKIKLGSNAAKKPNDATQISDPFHVWSRSVFDGITVRKVDIDAIIISKSFNGISAIIEIKRSKKAGIGKWLPYMDKQSVQSDYWNYIMCFTLCKILMCDFLTFHHELIESGLTFDDDTEVELFRFGKNTLISEETIRYFSSEKNRIVYKGTNFS